MTKVRHKASSGVQRLKCRLRQAREHRVAVVQPHRYQRQHKEDGDAFANMAADLAESANVEEADCYDLGNMLLHRQFRIEQNAKVAHDV